jgi:short-subunit dehydrogenase
MDQTKAFRSMADARSVAQAGYDGMLAGKLDVVVGLTLYQRVMVALIPFMPKKMILNKVRKIQEVNP